MTSAGGAVLPQPALLWRPGPDARKTSRVGRYMDWLERERGVAVADFAALHAWSVTALEDFWQSLWDYFGITSSTPPTEVLSARTMPGARWFTGARLNYAEHIVGGRFAADAVAVVARSQTRPPITLTFGELAAAVGRARTGLERLAIGPGDRVVGYLPNIPETLIAFLAAASLGATWATCPPEFGERSVIDRFSQLEPGVLLTVAGYRYGDADIDRTGNVASIARALPTLRHVVEVPYGATRLGDSAVGAPLVSWDELVAEDDGLGFLQVPFDHPLCVLFSSGTTGLPKAIIHGHGGLLLEHLKNHALSWDLGPGDRLLWFTTTAWMMWNALVSTLLTGASIVMLDGSPLYPDAAEQWRLAAAVGATMLGVSPSYLSACRKAGVRPREIDGLRLREVCTAGAPLPPDAAAWIYEQVGDDTLLMNGSGGTDVCSGIVQGNPLLPVWAGAISGRCLGVATAAFDPAGDAVVGRLGELVITEPMPSMPVGFWNDADGSRYRAAYFEDFPGVWRQGDWVQFFDNGSCLVTGRSDATLNRGGVRLGTGEFYRVVEELDAVRNSLVVHLEDADGGPGELILFVELADGERCGDEMKSTITARLCAALSPRHAPDTIVPIRAVPLSLTGKKLELPVKRILQGHDPASVASRDALADPAALDPYIDFAAERAARHLPS
jgi:acetoacetyl-CoA synthetase